MAYEPTNWNKGDTITASKLNNIEGGVAEANSEYVPKEWVCGETITADALNNIEQGIQQAIEECSGGGGGSSDFSTATVTIVDSETGSVSEPYALPILTLDAISLVNVYARDNSHELTVPLYKGVLMVDAFEDIVVSGDAVYSVEDGIVSITGNCSIKGMLMH